MEALAGRYVVDLNSASFAELLALPELGPALAQRIVDYRTKHGPFLCVDDLTQVRGVGAKTLEQLKPMLAVGSPDSASLDSLAER